MPNVGDWVLVRARVTGVAKRGTDTLSVRTVNGMNFLVMESDVHQVLARPSVDWESVRMGSDVMVVGIGAGRFVTHGTRNGEPMVCVLVNEGAPPEWYRSIRCSLV